MKRILPSVLLIAAMPLYAQTPPATSTAPVAGHERGTMEHTSPTNNDAQSQTASVKAKTTTKTTTRTTRATRLASDAVRLAALLHDAQTNAAVSVALWRTIANEANTLANRIYANSRGTARTHARELRTHVRAFRTAALAGDAAEARRHATQALPHAYGLAD